MFLEVAGCYMFGPQIELAMRGSNGLERWPRALVVHFDQEKLVLGGTCSRLAYTKQAVMSSNSNIYNSKSTLFCPDGSSRAWTRFGKSGNLENPQSWNPKHIKNGSSQNPNPCRLKCRQGLDWPEKYLPCSISCHFMQFCLWTGKM